jgi:hypothetical protein
MTVGDVLNRLHKVRKAGTRQWTALCPAHEDRNPSLSVGLGEHGRVLLTCHAGCEFDAIRDALGFTAEARPAPYISRPMKPRAYTLTGASVVYDYPNANGAVFYKVARYEPKEFRPWHLDEQGDWALGLGKVRRVPYRLPELRKASSDVPVLLLEGEKDVDRAYVEGFTATTTQGGARNWSAHAQVMAQELAGRQVVILPDADDPGSEYASAALATLKTTARTVVILRLPRLTHREKHGDDLSDWLDKHGGTEEELRTLIASVLSRSQSEPPPEGEPESAPGDDRWHPQIQSLSDLMKKDLPPTRYVVDKLIPEGVTLVGAKPKKGKTTLMMHIGCSSAHGSPALGALSTEKVEVLYLALEDNERRMQRRIRQMLQGDSVPDGFYIVYEWLPLDRGGLEALRDYLEQHPAIGLVVIDTLEHVRPTRRANNGLYADDYSAVRGLQRLASDLRIAIVPIHHLRKAPADDPFDEFNGSEGLMASVDNAIVLRTVNGVNGMLELNRRGRDYEDDTPLAIKGDKDSLLWTLAGEAREVFRSVERQAIVDLLKAHPQGMTPKDIAQTLDKNDNTTRRLLQKMLEETPPPIKKEGEVYIAC